MIGFLPNTSYKSGVTEHIRLEIIILDNGNEIIYSLIELINSKIKVKDSVVRNEIDFDVSLLHLLNINMSLLQ
jgi:hypothetical protein